MTCRAINALPAVVGAWQYPGGGLLSSASGSKFIGKDVMQQAHVHAPAKRLMPMIKLGEMLINPEGTKFIVYISSLQIRLSQLLTRMLYVEG